MVFQIIILNFLILVNFLYPLQEYYEQGDFKNCVEKASRLDTRKMSRVDKFYYAECLFLLGQREKAFSLYESILEEADSIREQAYGRMLDIFLQTENKDYLPVLYKYFKENLPKNGRFTRIIRYFLQKGLWEELKRFYLLNPVNLSKEEWQKIFSQNPLLAEEILEKSPHAKEEKSNLFFELCLQKGDYEKAEKFLEKLDFPLAKKKYLYFILELHKNNAEKAEQIILPLCQETPLSCLEGAEAFFEKGFPEKAINLIEVAKTKGVFFVERKIFYLLAIKNHEEALLELEKAKEDEKISPYLYQQLLHKITKHWGIKNLYSSLEKINLKESQKCEIKLETLFSYNFELLDEEIQKIFLNCPKAKERDNLSRLFSAFLSQNRYNLILKLWQSEYEVDPNLRPIYLKTLVNIGEYKNALGFLEKLYPKEPYPDEILYEKAKIYFFMKDFLKAKSLFVNLNYAESREYLWECLVALAEWEELQREVEQSLVHREKNFYLAIWSLAQNQVSQAEKLLEQYLEDPGKKGNQAVYLLFVLRYFPQEERGKLAYLVSRFPDYVEDKDFLDYPWLFKEKPNPQDESEVFVLYWYIRYLLNSPAQRERAKALLENLKENPNALFLRQEVLYLLAQLKEEKTILINEYPFSPFRLLIK